MKSKHHDKLIELLSIEYNCQGSAFLGGDNVITESKAIEGRRRYTDEKYFFHMATLGSGAVVTADPCLFPFLEEYVKDKKGHWLFEYPNLKALERELNKFSYTLSPTYHMFLPSERVEIPGDFDVKWLFDSEIHHFYGDERFPNAICEKFLPNRPDRIAVIAYDGDEMMGMAGCSEDADGWMQIGVDVMPRYRSKGIGTYLVNLLKNKIEDMGDVPFYGTSLSNYHSWNIALNCGFRPAWVEIGADRIDK